jgi:hypothetical protein
MKDSWQRIKNTNYKLLVRKLRLLKEGKENEKTSNKKIDSN